MQRKLSAALLLAVLFLGISSTAAMASSPEPLPFGSEAVPLTMEELEEIEGAWLTEAIVGGICGGITYLITTPVSDWSLTDGIRHVAAGAVTGWFCSLF